MHLKTNSRGRQQGFSEAGVSRQVGFVVVLAAGHCLTEPCCDGLAEWRDPSKTPVFDEPVPRPSGKRRDARTARPAVEVLISHVRGRPSRLVLPCRYQSLCLSSRDSPGAFPPAIGSTPALIVPGRVWLGRVWFGVRSVSECPGPIGSSSLRSLASPFLRWSIPESARSQVYSALTLGVNILGKRNPPLKVQHETQRHNYTV
jgi:hypothetical protein